MLSGSALTFKMLEVVWYRKSPHDSSIFATFYLNACECTLLLNGFWLPSAVQRVESFECKKAWSCFSKRTEWWHIL